MRDRAAEFEVLYDRATSPSYRELWRSQAHYYGKEAGNGPDGGAGVVVGSLGNDVADAAGRLPGAAVTFRAANEAAWARFLNALGEPWKYEALETEISRAIRYMPDFWLPQRLVWIEIKSEPPTPGEIRVARLLRQATERRVYVLDGWPWPRSYGVSVFSEAGDARVGRADWCDVALCGLLDCSFAALGEAFQEARREAIR